MIINVWNFTLRIIKKLQFFTRTGCVFWSVLGLLSGMMSLYMEFNASYQVNAGVVVWLWNAISFLELVLLALMPMAIYQLKDYAKEVQDSLTSPTKLFWLFFLGYIADVTGTILNVGVFGSNQIPYMLHSTIRSLYHIIFGVMVGCFCKTLESRIRLPSVSRDGKSVLKEATEGLRDYQNLKKCSQLGLFMMFSCFTLMIISGIYATIRNTNVLLTVM